MKKLTQYLTLIILLVCLLGCNKERVNTLSDPFLSVFLPNVLNRIDSTQNIFYPQSSRDIWVDELYIFDSWGSQIFFADSFPSNAPKYGWDGSIDGLAVALGTYGYIVMMRDGDEQLTLKGDLTIIN